MALDCAFESAGCSKQEQNSKENTLASIGSAGSLQEKERDRKQFAVRYICSAMDLGFRDT
jgi:hypothetical protein